MSTFKTLLPPPSRLGSMASLTSFAIDSTRARSVVNDLATLHSAHAEEPAASSAPVPWASTSRFSLSPLPEKAPRLVPASFSPASSSSSSPSPPASPCSSPIVRHSPSPLFQYRWPPPALPEPSVPAVFQDPIVPPPHEPAAQPHLRPVASAFPLLYVITTSDQVQASSTGAQLSSYFYHGGVPSFQAPPEAYRRHIPTKRSPEPVHHEDRPAKKPRRSRSHGPSSDNLPLTKAVATQATTSEQGSDAPRNVQLSEGPIVQPARVPDDTRSVKMQCRWPGCTFSDDPGKLWSHIKDAHGEEGTPTPNDPDPQRGAAMGSATSSNEDVAVVPPPPFPSVIQGWPSQEAISSYYTNFGLWPSATRCVYDRI